MTLCSDVMHQSRIHLDTSEHHHSQAALLPAEGIGAHGNYFIRVSTRVRGPNLYLTVRGYTPAMDMPEYRGAFRFYGYARLLKGERQIVRKRLERASAEIWPDDRYIPIGSAVICIPEGAAGSLILEVEAGYDFDSGAGFITPIPPTTKFRKPLQEPKP